MSQKPKSAERRWIILAQDGRHVTMGRAAPPSEAEVQAAAAGLTAQGLAGWLATLDGDYWSRRRVALTPLQILGDGATLELNPICLDHTLLRQTCSGILLA